MNRQNFLCRLLHVNVYFHTYFTICYIVCVVGLDFLTVQHLYSVFMLCVVSCSLVHTYSAYCEFSFIKGLPFI